jgi:hypothetical protein
MRGTAAINDPQAGYVVMFDTLLCLCCPFVINTSQADLAEVKQLTSRK